MNGFYKHQSGNHVWVLEVLGPKESTGKKNRFGPEVHARQFVADGKCPTDYDTFVSELEDPNTAYDEFDKPHWLKITDEEAVAIVKNLDEQKAEAEYRKTDECKQWAEELAKALEGAGFSTYAYNGSVRISTRNGGESTITKSKAGKMIGEKTGYPDPDW